MLNSFFLNLKKIPKSDLDFFLFFRFFAAILVVRQHIKFPPFDIQILNIDINFGYLISGGNFSGDFALVFFFFLTSYLISKNFFNKRYNLSFSGIKEFYIKRIARIAPLYYFLTFFTIFFVYPYLLEIVHLKNPSLMLDLIRIFTFTYYDISGLPYWNQVYWAISLEMTFYFLAPFLILLIQKLFNQKIFSATVLILILLLNFLPFNFYPFRHRIIDFSLIFLAGIFFAKLLHDFPEFLESKIQFFKNKSFFFSSISTFILYLVLVTPLRNILPQINQNGIIILVMILFVFSVENYDKFRKNIDKNFAIKKRYIWQILNYLGALSYGIFLSHMLFVTKVNELYRLFLFEKLGESAGGLILLFITIIFVVPASIYFYEGVEKPCAKFILKNLPKPKKVI